MIRLKRLTAGITAAMLVCMGSMPAYGATTKVSSISLVVDSEIKVGDEYNIDDVTIETKSDKYVIGDMEFENDGYEWGATDTPVIKVYVEANDGYYLSVTAKNIKIKGAEYASGKKVDSKTMLLTLRLPSLSQSLGEIGSVRWDSNSAGSWDEAYNAGLYEVRLYRDGKTVKSIQAAETSINFASMMLKEGNYTFKVRAVNKVKADVKSEWVESSGVHIDKATADQNKAVYGNSSSGLENPGQAATAQVQDGWNKDGTGWWFRNTDGTYTTNNWQQIDGKWYFFNNSGYMQTGWILWNYQYYYCDDANGDMLVSTTTPDGFRVDSSGVWVQ